MLHFPTRRQDALHISLTLLSLSPIRAHTSPSSHSAVARRVRVIPPKRDNSDLPSTPAHFVNPAVPGCLNDT